MVQMCVVMTSIRDCAALLPIQITRLAMELACTCRLVNHAVESVKMDFFRAPRVKHIIMTNKCATMIQTRVCSISTMGTAGGRITIGGNPRRMSNTWDQICWT